MGAVGSEDPVSFADVVRQPHRCSLLPDRQMARTLDDRFSELVSNFFLRSPDKKQGFEPFNTLVPDASSKG
jgi:hypothetical protein